MRHRKRPDLDTSLDAYAAATKAAADAPSWNDRLGSWPIYAAATGSALALATSAGAGVIYGTSGVFASASVAPGADIGTNYFKIGRASTAGFAFPGLFANHLYSSAGRFGGLQISASCYCGTTQFFVGPYSSLARNYPLRRFNSGEVISGGAPSDFSYAGFLAAKCTGSTAACFGPSFDVKAWGAPSEATGTGIAGFKVGGNYGWIRLKWESDEGFPNKITAIDWAIEDSGGAIFAGETPEPGTMSLILLAAGAAGILAWRRRKRAVDSKTEA